MREQLSLRGDLPATELWSQAGLGSSALPPVSHQRRKQWLVLWRRSTFAIDLLTDSALFPVISGLFSWPSGPSLLQ